MIQHILWVREAKDVLVLQMWSDHGREMSFYYFYLFLPKVTVVTRKQGEKKGRRSSMKEFPKLPSSYIYLKKKHIHFLVHGHFTWSTFGLHLARGPKALNIHFLEIRLWKCDHEVVPCHKTSLWTWTGWVWGITGSSSRIDFFVFFWDKRLTGQRQSIGGSWPLDKFSIK